MSKRPVILCVDDEKSVLSTLKQQLSVDLNEEFEIEIAESADEALEVIEELQVDSVRIAAIISDQIMPGMKGDELLIEVHQSDPDIPKILLTGQASLIAVQNAINKASLYRYISKPWERNDLTMTVSQAAKSYLQKEKIDHFDQSIKLLKSINNATRTLSSEINSDKLVDTYITMVEEHTQFDNCILVFNRGKEVEVYGYLYGVDKKKKLENLTKEEVSKIVETIGSELPNEKDFVPNSSKAMIPLETREASHGYVFVKNSGDIISESQFEMFKILTKQLIVSYETAGLYQNIQKQKVIIERKNKSILSSLEYAQKIQTALMPEHDILNQYFPDNFVFYSPRDIVSGDFYMFRDTEESLFIICADCTGHGVPGAFITILGRMIIREIAQNNIKSDPSEILEALDKYILNIFHKNGESEIRDGMDISIVEYNKKTEKFRFAGAKSSIYYIRDGELNKFKGSKYEIGNYLFKDVEQKFETIDLDLRKGDLLYLFTDGLQDQFGGEDFSKIGPRKVQALLKEVSTAPMEEQYKVINQFFHTWKGEDKAQTDDVLMLGIRV